MAAPTVTISSVMPGTSIPANTGTVEVSWSVSNTPPNAAAEVWVGRETVGMEVLPDGVFTDMGGDASNIFPTTDGSFTSDIGGTSSLFIQAKNEDGETIDREWFFNKIRVGYHRATVPGAPVRESDLERICGFLEDIDDRLNDNVLTTLPDYIEEYNSLVPEEHHFPDFDDMDYLSGGVGTGNLTDDILSAMHDVLIYIKASTLPRGHRPGTLVDPEEGTLCDETEYGVIAGLSTRQWVSICVDNGADDLTLLHELFHYASISHNDSEPRAFAISMCAYGWLPG